MRSYSVAGESRLGSWGGCLVLAALIAGYFLHAYLAGI